MSKSKLVRDNIPEIIKKSGAKPLTHIASNEEYYSKLIDKLQEEVDEFKKDDNPEEIADILEVIDAIIDYKKIKRTDLNKIKNKKAKERGKFKKRIILDRIKN
jgi:predicted house-cleaning noncanonical NTP pyrophosphatase (MazG superfamily)